MALLMITTACVRSKEFNIGDSKYGFFAYDDDTVREKKKDPRISRYATTHPSAMVSQNLRCDRRNLRIHSHSRLALRQNMNSSALQRAGIFSLRILLMIVCALIS